MGTTVIISVCFVVAILGICAIYANVFELV